QWVARVGQAAGVRPFGERVGDGLRDDHAAQRHVARVDHLGETDQVGDHAPVIDGEPLTAPADPGHDLVADHHDPVAIAQVANAGQVAVRGHDDAVRPDHRLQQNGRHGGRTLELDDL